MDSRVSHIENRDNLTVFSGPIKKCMSFVLLQIPSNISLLQNVQIEGTPVDFFFLCKSHGRFLIGYKHIVILHIVGEFSYIVQ